MTGSPVAEGREGAVVCGTRIEGALFDLQGTLVDFYSTLLREGGRIGRSKAIEADWAGVIDEWRRLYRQGMDEIIAGQRAWISTDTLYREALDRLLDRRPWGAAFSAIERDELNGIWRRLDPWPDTLPGMTRLKPRLILGTLSNGSMASVIRIVKSGGLPFDCVLTAELVRSFKPDPRVYALGIDAMGLPPERILMVACHKYDLKAAKQLGFKTAFLRRPFEFGPTGSVDLTPEPYFDLAADSLTELADRLSC